MKLPIGHDNNHQLMTPKAHFDYHMPKDTPVGTFLINGDVIGLNEFPHEAHDPVDDFMLYGALFNIDQIMTPGSIKAQHRAAFYQSHRELGFIAIVPWLIHAYGRMDSNIPQMPDSFQRIPYFLRLIIQLGIISQVLELAPSAGLEIRAPRFDAKRRIL